MENEENMITEKQAARLVDRIIELGHSKEEAYETLAYVMNAERKENKKKGAPTTTKK